MSIVDQLIPEFYEPKRIVIEIRPDAILTTESLSLFTDVRILNADGRQLATDHPTPQATQQQLEAFLSWIESNLAAYENNVGLTRWTTEAE